MKNAILLAVMATVALAFAPAHAIDITAATTELTELGTNVIAIGGLMLSAVVGGVAFKWVIAYLI